MPWCLEMGTVESLVLGGGYGKGERRPRSWFLGFGMGRTEVLVLHDRHGEGGLALGSLTDGSPAGTTQGDAPGGGTHPTWEKGTLEIPSKEGDDLQTPSPHPPMLLRGGSPAPRTSQVDLQLGVAHAGVAAPGAEVLHHGGLAVLQQVIREAAFVLGDPPCLLPLADEAHRAGAGGRRTVRHVAFALQLTCRHEGIALVKGLGASSTQGWDAVGFGVDAVRAEERQTNLGPAGDVGEDGGVGDIIHSALGCCWLWGLCYPCQRPLDQLGVTRRHRRGSQCCGHHPPIQHCDAAGFGVTDIRAKGPRANQGPCLHRTECNELGEAIRQRSTAGAASCPRGLLGLDPGMLFLGSTLCCTPSSQISSAFWHGTNPSWKQRVQREGGQTDSSRGTEGRPQPHHGPRVVLIKPSLGRGGRSRPGSWD